MKKLVLLPLFSIPLLLVTAFHFQGGTGCQALICVGVMAFVSLAIWPLIDQVFKEMA